MSMSPWEIDTILICFCLESLGYGGWHENVL